MMLKVGKLYCVREQPLLVFATKQDEFLGQAHLKGVYIDTSQPFLILDSWDQNIGADKICYQVLFNDRKGWIYIGTDNEIKEIV